MEVSLEVSLDSGLVESGLEVSLEVSLDSGLESGLEVSLDVSLDSGLESGLEVGLDVSLDSGLDFSLEVGLISISVFNRVGREKESFLRGARFCSRLRSRREYKIGIRTESAE